ncbi:segregation/condensation protein B [Clostridium sp. MSJ-11]|uniref:Segregation and condensation protein B n=1 Tax=Clostridium mobile TaxID=2841512 RepID=A0ABS6EDP0_9CLOT|nr:SMC-Scp complex subunit ScpB [Clostridium mobile]MBU5482902.1 segregation/condensation protein B [Clostridium mobile]
MNKVNLNQMDVEGNCYKSRYISVIESLLFASGEPLKIRELSNILDCNINFTKELINNMKENYEALDRGIMLLELDDSIQLCTKKENSSFLQKLLKTNVRQSLSQAALESLAIIAYRQPITRIDIDEIRGVKSDRAIQTLVEKKLIKECGRLDVPGRPILYSTTEEFLKNFGLQSLEQMPNLEDVLNMYEEE